LVSEAAEANGAPQKKVASVNSSRGTNDRNPDKGEVGGSSPPRPTNVYAVIHTFSTCRTFAQKAICQKFAKNPASCAILEIFWNPVAVKMRQAE
jgi:hypothetical protein